MGRRRTGFRRILVPLLEGDSAVRAIAVACLLTAERGAALSAVAVVEVPHELPLDADMGEDEERLSEFLRLARAEADRYGVSIETRLLRGRQAGEAIVQEARRGQVDLIVLQASRQRRASLHGPLFSQAAASVLEQAPCRVLIATPEAPR